MGSEVTGAGGALTAPLPQAATNAADASTAARKSTPNTPKENRVTDRP
jgi:hypothetical protein